MALTEEQRKQLQLQLDAHIHDRYEIDIELGENAFLKSFVVQPKVMRPEIMTSVHLARWLFLNKAIYENKTAIDMGCGSGIQGIVIGLYGAKHVVFSDISHPAVENTKENIEKFRLEGKSLVVEGDLFENINGKADVIVFNHPFFSDNTIEKLLVSSAMIERGKLIHKFLEGAKNVLSPGGMIIMPYFHFAGPENDPHVQAPKHDYNVVEKLRANIPTGLQRGVVSIYEIRL